MWAFLDERLKNYSAKNISAQLHSATHWYGRKPTQSSLQSVYVQKRKTAFECLGSKEPVSSFYHRQAFTQMIRLRKRDLLMSKIVVKIIQIPSALARGLGLSHFHCSLLELQFYAWKVGLCYVNLLCISVLLIIFCVDNTIISKE